MTRNGNGNFIPIELTEDLIKQEIVTKFIFDKRSKLLILSLNHKYKKKTVVSPIFKNDWLKTIQKFKDQMTSKGMTEDHMNMLCDIVDYNYEKILDIDEDENANAKFKMTKFKMTTANRKGNKKPSSGNIHVMECLVCTSL